MVGRNPSPGIVLFHLSAEVRAGLIVQAARYGATPFMLLAGSLADALARHLGRSQVTVGTPFAGARDNDSIGSNFTMLPLVLARQATVAECVQRARTVCLAAYALAAPGNVFDVVLDYQGAGEPRPSFDGAQVAALNIQFGLRELTVKVRTHSGALDGRVEFDSLQRNTSDVSLWLSGWLTFLRDLSCATEVHPALAELWQEVLGGPVRPDDNFFDRGGNSLDALVLSTRIERDLGVHIPLSAFAAAPTLAEQDRIFRHGWRQLAVVPLRHGTNPLFLIPSMGGEAIMYSELSRHVGPGQAVFALQPAGIEPAPVHGVPDLSRLYCAEIRKVQPEGPYRLGGHSLGGLLAFEIATQLQATGQRVDLLCLFDTRLPSSMRLRSLGFVRKRLVRSITGQQPATPEPVGPLPWWSLERNNFVSYRIKPYRGRVVVFRASTQPWDLRRSRALGWDRYVTPGPVVIDFPGNHEDVLHEPVASRAAMALQQLLQGRSPDPF